jgi:hypothetical protein
MQNKDQLVKELSDLMIKYSLGNIYCAGEEGVFELTHVDKLVQNDSFRPAFIRVDFTPKVKREIVEIPVKE